MKRPITFIAVMVPVVVACRQVQAQNGVGIDDHRHQVLEKINSASLYEVPKLDLLESDVYAFTPEELTPFRGQKPYKRHFLIQMEYTGPRRAIPEPKQVSSVKIGFIGPIHSTVSVATGGKSHEEPLGTMMLRGCMLAVEEANARGGHRGKKIPYELVVQNDNGLWGVSGNVIIDMAYDEKVWAIVGTIDGANTHIAIRVALKAEIFMVNTGDTDPTLVETNIPWIARVISDDRQQCYLLLHYMVGKLGYRRIGIIRGSNRYGRVGVRELVDGLRRLGCPAAIEMAYKLGASDFTLQLQRLKSADVEAVVHWGDARESALILNQMRAMGIRQPYFTCDRSISDEFVKMAGRNAEGVVAASPWNPTRNDQKLEAFRERFRKRFGCEAETYAAHGYDGMNMLIWAIEVAGLNRAKIRDVFAHRRTPWPGVTGDIQLSPVLDDMGEVYLARYENGQWKYYSREELGLPKLHMKVMTVAGVFQPNSL